MLYEAVDQGQRKNMANFIFLFYIYPFLAALGLGFCTWAFSGGGEQGLCSSCGMRTSHCGDFSCCGARALGHVAFSSYDMQALQHRLSSCSPRGQFPRAMWDLLRAGMEPLSPALAGRLLTRGPPGKS